MSMFEKSNIKIGQKFFSRDELFLEPFQVTPITLFDETTLNNDEFQQIFKNYPLKLAFNPLIVEKLSKNSLSRSEKINLTEELVKTMDALHACRQRKKK